MASLRAAPLRSILRSQAPRLCRKPPYQAQLWRSIQKRTYASANGHGAHEAGSDMPWLIGSIAITLPCLYFVWPSSSTHAGGGHGKHEKHEKKPEKVEESGSTDETSAEESKSEESESSDEEQATPDSSDDESEKPEAVVRKGDGDGPKEDTDAKGSNKARTESEDGAKQGENKETDKIAGDKASKDMNATATKPPGGVGTQSAKQEGLSNTDIKHSTDTGSSSEKSTKPGSPGTPESAKVKGTIDSHQE
ncbi:MAG: hypothetical protein M1834_005465 [Cirrosporium novae-zelandiae]|nr:MAG: hypothetical protein M1834_005465 [Cirrosporium novae-zelandiae]